MEGILDLAKKNEQLLKGAAAASSATLLGAYLLCRTQTNNVLSDIKETIELVRMRNDLKRIEGTKDWTVVDLFDQNVVSNPEGDAFCFVGEPNQPARTVSFREADEASNRIANWAISEGLKKGDVVGLVMDNRPEFIITWLGLAKIGAVTALINTNLMNDPLIHSLTISNAERFIVGIEHKDKAIFGKEHIAGKKWFLWGGSEPGMQMLDSLLTNPQPIDRSIRKGCGPSSELMYIYTSGTTGNPKAGIIKHIRFYMAGVAFARYFNVNSKDRIYCSLPLYHSAGGMIGVCLSWCSGACLVFRRKFSAKQFWSDVEEQKCTVMQYIGELCRYLLSQPETQYDKSRIRLAIGNGLRPDIWKQFQKRFNIDVIAEFYAATEGNASVLNSKNKAGAVGYIPPLIMKLYPLELVRLEDDNETPKRDKNGLCILCKPGEKGELLGKIDNSDPTRKFDGYLNKKATEKKILRDVKKKGDQYFRTGDLLKVDSEGFFYFVDRLGDTFRWKGENVATSEVEFVMSKVPGIALVNVYGVLVPHHDGRAGCAALITDEKFSFEELYETVTNELPSYARPLFLRIMAGMDTTSTHKLQKVQVRKEGIDINKITDKFYFRDDKQKKFVPLTPEIYEQIQQGTIKSKL